MMTLYELAWLATLLITSPYWLLRIALRPGFGRSLRERLGTIPQPVQNAVAGKRVIWLHAVSVGETLAASRLVSELQDRLPEVAVVVSTTTETGQKLAKERFGEDRVCFFPLDFGWIVRRYLKALHPELMVLMESELWPSHLSECRRAGVPVVVANARVSDRSFPRYLRLRFVWSRLFRYVRYFLPQSEEDGRRLLAIGATSEQVRVTGNLKYDIRAAAETPLVRLLQEHLPVSVPVLVCGSTLVGEEEAVLGCSRVLESAVTILAPRHPERFPVAAALLDARGIAWQRLSEWRQRPAQIEPGAVLLLDSIGELASLYLLARVAFVGGSLFGGGGHNPLEPAQWGVPVVQGPSYENFRAPVDALRAVDAISIVSAEELCSGLQRLLQQPEVAAEMGTRAREVFAAQAGATGRTVEIILGLLRRKAA